MNNSEKTLIVEAKRGPARTGRFTLKQVFNEYVESVRDVVKKAGMQLPNVSFVFFPSKATGKSPKDELYFVSPITATELRTGDFKSPLERMVKEYPDSHYELKYILAVFPGMVITAGKNPTEFWVFGGMAAKDAKKTMSVVEPDPTDPVHSDAQRVAIDKLLSTLRNEYIVQKSMSTLM